MPIKRQGKVLNKLRTLMPGNITQSSKHEVDMCRPARNDRQSVMSASEIIQVQNSLHAILSFIFERFYFFYLREREGTSRRRGRATSRLPAKQEPDGGWIPESGDHDPSQRQMPGRLSHPGTPGTYQHIPAGLSLQLHYVAD